MIRPAGRAHISTWMFVIDGDVVVAETPVDSCDETEVDEPAVTGLSTVLISDSEPHAALASTSAATESRSSVCRYRIGTSPCHTSL